ncbi:helix-turn-helix domain-containing protein [Trinickia dinghuensis]|uniref:Helix-turn-helix domain-containing protein n=1 Tax=Trinickia dinghuensis TaxID=2291023 RepID=A0A3D8K4K9_9BURK|nr:helix-turn-helix domain-containing protein [Trinickia dinghuensis]
MAPSGLDPDPMVPSLDASNRRQPGRDADHGFTDLEPRRMNTLTQMSFIPGTEVLFLGRPHRIAQAVDFDEVLLRDLETKQVVRAKLIDLQIVQPTSVRPRPDLLSIEESDWSEAERREAIIRPLLAQHGRKRDDVVARAAEFGLHANTLYKSLKAYESAGLMTALLPKQQRKDKAATKLQAEIEAIIEDVIKTEYLTTQKKSKQWVCNEVRRRCSAADGDVPQGHLRRRAPARRRPAGAHPGRGPASARPDAVRGTDRPGLRRRDRRYPLLQRRAAPLDQCAGPAKAEVQAQAHVPP